MVLQFFSESFCCNTKEGFFVHIWHRLLPTWTKAACYAISFKIDKFKFLKIFYRINFLENLQEFKIVGMTKKNTVLFIMNFLRSRNKSDANFWIWWHFDAENQDLKISILRLWLSMSFDPNDMGPIQNGSGRAPPKNLLVCCVKWWWRHNFCDIIVTNVYLKNIGCAKAHPPPPLTPPLKWIILVLSIPCCITFEILNNDVPYCVHTKWMSLIGKPWYLKNEP